MTNLKGALPMPAPGFQGITEQNLENWFTYHKPTEAQNEQYLAIREAALVFARTIVANTPVSADQSSAIRKVREAAMCANQSIACGGH